MKQRNTEAARRFGSEPSILFREKELEHARVDACATAPGDKPVATEQNQAPIMAKTSA